MRRFVVFLLPLMVLAFVVAAGTQQAAAQSKTVSILATWGGDEEAGFRAVLDAFSKESGVAYSYEGNRDSTVVLKSRVAANNAPDIAFLPRPGEVAAYARQGSIVPLNQGQADDMLPSDLLNANYGKAWIDLGTVDGKFYALIAKANSKSTFWYKPASLRAIGAKVPDTWDQLLALEDKYIAAGKTPLSIGATGRVDAHRLVREHLRAHGGSRHVHEAPRDSRSEVDRSDASSPPSRSSSRSSRPRTRSSPAACRERFPRVSSTPSTWSSGRIPLPSCTTRAGS